MKYDLQDMYVGPSYDLVKASTYKGQGDCLHKQNSIDILVKKDTLMDNDTKGFLKGDIWFESLLSHKRYEIAIKDNSDEIVDSFVRLEELTSLSKTSLKGKGFDSKMSQAETLLLAREALKSINDVIQFSDGPSPKGK